jgi:hypothetical protein
MLKMGFFTRLGKTTQSFEGVPQRVWEFHIGEYQVCEKWLKDRRERVLPLRILSTTGRLCPRWGDDTDYARGG